MQSPIALQLHIDLLMCKTTCIQQGTKSEAQKKKNGVKKQRRKEEEVSCAKKKKYK